MNLPEIIDFSVLQRHPRKGVGLYREYDSAQRMYARRGNTPDGTGVWYQDRQCVQHGTVCIADDDLVLFLSKRLR